MTHAYSTYPQANPLSEHQVAEYLVRHPDFLDRHPELLSQMAIPHPSGIAVSLIERQVVVLREKTRALEDRLENLLHIARENAHLLELLHRLTLELVSATDLQGATTAILQALRVEFRVDAPVLRLSSTAPALRTWLQHWPRLHPWCGEPPPGLCEVLYETEPPALGSVAVLPLLRESRPLGLLVLGSVDPQRFQDGHDDAFLRKLQEVIAARLASLLPPGTTA